MIELSQIISFGFIFSGAFFMFIGSIGLLRFPDFYTRTHASSKTDTLGIMLMMVGLALYEGLTLNSAKLLLAFVFVAIANPVASHALTRAAFKAGLKPWFKNTNGSKQAGSQEGEEK